ncbi:hypothetical protein V8E36_009107 [Tilletia maclaganii]
MQLTLTNLFATAALASSAFASTNSLKNSAHHVRADAIIEPTVKELVVDFHNVLSKTNKLVVELVNNVGAGKLNTEVVLPLGKALGGAVHGLESKLVQLSPELGKLLDPVLHEVDSDLAFLGIHLRSLPEQNEDLVSARASSHKAAERKIQAHLSTMTHDLARLTKLTESKKKPETKVVKKVVKEVLADASEAAKVLAQTFKDFGVKVSTGKGKGPKRTDTQEEQDINDTIFGKLLTRLVHDLICILHAVIKLTVNLLGNLGLKELKEVVKEIDVKALEPLFVGLKQLAKGLGLSLSGDFDPVLAIVQKLLTTLGL